LKSTLVFQSAFFALAETKNIRGYLSCRTDAAIKQRKNFLRKISLKAKIQNVFFYSSRHRRFAKISTFAFLISRTDAATRQRENF